jgi:short-subunit dehydrogenase
MPLAIAITILPVGHRSAVQKLADIAFCGRADSIDMVAPSTRTALVTGASSGIGRELARLLAADGYQLVLVARNRKRLEETAAELERDGLRIAVLTANLSEPGGADELFGKVVEAGIQVDVLVNNAGFATNGPYSRNDMQREMEMIQLNVTALAALTRLALPGMIERRRGRILNVASTAAFQPGPYMAVYYATKAFVLSFSEAIAKELQGTRVTVTTVCPGPVRTAFQDRAGIQHAAVAGDWIIMNAAPVARAAYGGMLKGKRVVIPGLFNKLHWFGIRFIPRDVLLRIIASLNKDRTVRRPPPKKK